MQPRVQKYALRNAALALLLGGFFCGVSPLYGEEEVTFVEGDTYATAAYTINEKQGSFLLMDIPQDYLLLQPLKESLAQGVLEYIPPTEKDMQEWSEKIAVYLEQGKETTAREVLEHREKILRENVRDFTLLSPIQTKDFGRYQEGTVSFTSKSPSGRTEVSFLLSFVGPEKAVTTQCTLPLPAGQSPQKFVKEMRKRLNKLVIAN